MRKKVEIILRPPPLVMTTILSQTLNGEALISTAILVVESLVIVAVSFYLFRSAPRRWRGNHHSFATIRAPAWEYS